MSVCSLQVQEFVQQVQQQQQQQQAAATPQSSQQATTPTPAAVTPVAHIQVVVNAPNSSTVYPA